MRVYGAAMPPDPDTAGPERTAYLVADGWDHAIELGSFVRLLVYPDGTRRVEHPCKVVDGTRLIIAPALGPEHQVDGTPELPHVHPSISCPDCGLHGFISMGRWTPC